MMKIQYIKQLWLVVYDVLNFSLSRLTKWSKLSSRVGRKSCCHLYQLSWRLWKSFRNVQGKLWKIAPGKISLLSYTASRWNEGLKLGMSFPLRTWKNSPTYLSRAASNRKIRKTYKHKHERYKFVYHIFCLKFFYWFFCQNSSFILNFILHGCIWQTHFTRVLNG